MKALLVVAGFLGVYLLVPSMEHSSPEFESLLRQFSVEGGGRQEQRSCRLPQVMPSTDSSVFAIAGARTERDAQLICNQICNSFEASDCAFAPLVEQSAPCDAIWSCVPQQSIQHAAVSH